MCLQSAARRILQHERPALQINAEDVLGDDAAAREVHSLLAHRHHQLRTFDPAREAGKILDFRREIELAQRQRSREPVVLGDGALIHDGLEVGPPRVNRASPGRRSRSDDDDSFCHV